MQYRFSPKVGKWPSPAIYQRRVILSFKTSKLKWAQKIVFVLTLISKLRVVSRTPATSKMKVFVTIVNDFQLLINDTKNSMLDVGGILGASLIVIHIKVFIYQSFLPCKAVTLIFCNKISCYWSLQTMWLYVW